VTYRIAPSKQCRKKLNVLRQSGKWNSDASLKEAVALLTTHDKRSLYVLAEHWKDHALKGNLRGIRELHLGFDRLLLYRINEEKRAIVLLDIVTHENLEKM